MANLTTLGKYEIRGKLGKGGMGTVYLARDTKLNREVAVKTIRSEELDSDEALSEYSRRFELEAQAIAKLNHPNIVQIYDSGEEAGVAYLAMEYVNGHDLKYFFGLKVAFSLQETMRLMTDLLDALAHAHEKGVWHRDIKPANVMIDTEGQVKLTDFGVSRIADSGERSRIGTMVGTLNYMAPEQVRNTGVSHRSDIFAAGVILYEFLTGCRPFTGEQYEISSKILNEDPPPPSQHNPDLPHGMDDVVATALAKDPARRFASARDFGAALKESMGGKLETAFDIDATRRFYAVLDGKVGEGGSGHPKSTSGSARSGTASRTEPSSPSENAEIEFWRSIKDGTDPDEYLLYLSRFPNGTYAELAKKRVAKYGGALPSPSPSRPPGKAKIEPSFGGGQNPWAGGQQAGPATAGPTAGGGQARAAWQIPAAILVVGCMAVGAFLFTRPLDGKTHQPVQAPPAGLIPAAPSPAVAAGAAQSSAAAAVASAVGQPTRSPEPAATVAAGASAPDAATTEKQRLEALQDALKRKKEADAAARAETERRENEAVEKARQNAARSPGAEPAPAKGGNCLTQSTMSAGDSSKTEAEACTAAKTKASAWVAHWKSKEGAAKGMDKYHDPNIGDCKCQAASCSVTIEYTKPCD